MGSWAFPSFLSLTPDLGVSKGSSEPFFVLFQVRVSRIQGGRIQGGRSQQRSPTDHSQRFESIFIHTTPWIHTSWSGHPSAAQKPNCEQAVLVYGSRRKVCN